MDNTAVFYTVNVGSIPARRTKKSSIVLLYKYNNKRFDNKSIWCYTMSNELRNQQRSLKN